MKNNIWNVVRIPGGDLVSELAGDFLLEIGADGFTVENNILNVFFRTEKWKQSLLDQIQVKIDLFVESGLLPDTTIKTDRITQEDWVGRWRRALGPVRAGKHFVIVPPGIEAVLGDGDIALNIEPRMAFGTGEHPTTIMALALLEKTVKKNDHVVDIGCGNGVLSIAALSLGAEKVLALDHEPESFQETIENAATHGFSEAITVSLEDVLEYKIPDQYDVMVANIFVNPILQGFKSWKTCLKDGANIIFTGVKEKEESTRLVSELKKAGYEVVESLTSDIWYAGLFRATCA